MPSESTNTTDKRSVGDVEIARIRIVPGNPRQWTESDIAEMAENIGRVGQIAPVTLRPSASKDHDFDLVDGELRFRACAALGHDEVFAVLHPNMDESRAADVALAANLPRWPLSAKFAFVIQCRKRGKDANEIHEYTRIPRTFIAKCFLIHEKVAPDLVKVLRASGTAETLGHLYQAASVGAELPANEMRWKAQQAWWQAEGWRVKQEKPKFRKMERYRIKIKAESIRKRCRIRGIRLTKHAANAVAAILLQTHGITQLPRRYAA